MGIPAGMLGLPANQQYASSIQYAALYYLSPCRACSAAGRFWISLGKVPGTPAVPIFIDTVFQILL
jgi:hypothetical protein